MGLQARPGAARSAPLESEKLPLPVSTDEDEQQKTTRHRERIPRHAIAPFLLLLCLASYLYSTSSLDFPFPRPAPSPVPHFITEGIKQCEIIARPPPNPRPFTDKRGKNDRFVKGTKPTWLKNATLWTGEKGGTEIIYGGDVLLDEGVIRKIGKGDKLEDALALAKGEVDEIDLHGAWLTPGIVDMHSHLAVGSSPSLEGSEDDNSLKAPILPWLRSLDGFNTHDAAFNLSIAGGITTMLVLPGSAGNIGGQAFTFKPRWTDENTPQSMQVEPPFVISPGKNGSASWERTGAWRHIKHACGENPLRVYGNTRMDSAWDFRRAYNEGKQLKDRQERWCESPKTQTEPFPEDLQWEVMADIIRGNVKVNIHCYETTDINTLVRISNEFQFPIAAFHHAHETYLVPELLKQAWGPVPPAVALFATNARYKREAYRGSEFAPKILADAGINVNMKSDHPVLDSRYLVYEAAQAHHYGLNFSSALSAVTTTPAKTLGLDHRLGYVRVGYDADLVVWDSFPLALGATPKQTYIDGIPQISHPHFTVKPAEAQNITTAGHYEEEIAEALATRGDPDLRPKKQASSVIFNGISSIYLPARATAMSDGDRLVIRDGEIACIGACETASDSDFEMIDLKGGSVTPGLITVGAPLGLNEIDQEPSTSDGVAYDPTSSAAELVEGLLVHGVDGASFGGKDVLLAYKNGITTAVSYPHARGVFAGLSYAFTTSAPHALSPHAIINSATALHLSLHTTKASTSTKIAFIRRLLLGEVDADNDITRAMKEVATGDLRLVIEVTKADIMAGLIRLKREVAPGMKMTFLGAHEAWLIADDIAKDNIGVIVAPSRSFPSDWDSRRILPGPPLSNQTLPAYLTSRGVTVGLGITEAWQARNTQNDAAWVYASNPEVFSKQGAIDLVSGNLEELLGLKDGQSASAPDENEKSWVAWEGDLFSGAFGRVRAVRSRGAEKVDLF